MQTYKTILISSLLFWGGITAAQASETQNSWESATAVYMSSSQHSDAGPPPPPPGAGIRNFRNSRGWSGQREASPQERGSGRDEVPGHIFLDR